jgi:hypothetical protein
MLLINVVIEQNIGSVCLFSCESEATEAEKNTAKLIKAMFDKFFERENDESTKQES